MERACGVEPYEPVAAGSGPDVLGPRPQRAAGRRLTVVVSPLGAFAAGALVVCSLALAWTLGRRAAPPRVARPAATADSLDEVRRMPPIPYNQLPVDQGFAD